MSESIKPCEWRNILSVWVFRQGSSSTPDEIVIDYSQRDSSLVCNRQ